MLDIVICVKYEMKKIHFLIITGALLMNVSYGQSKNQNKIDSLQKDVENLKIRVASDEIKIQELALAILDMNKLMMNFHSKEILMEVYDSSTNELNPDEQDSGDNDIEFNVDIKANFPGGESAFRSYVAGEFIYPQRCQDDKIDGYALLRFVVDEAGRISGINAVKETKSCPEFTKECIRVLQKSPRWVPGQKNGRFLKSWREIPIRLSISK
jgi:protein TonB